MVISVYVMVSYWEALHEAMMNIFKWTLGKLFDWNANQNTDAQVRKNVLYAEKPLAILRASGANASIIWTMLV